MLDLHILATVQTGWNALAADTTTWRALLSPFVSTAMADQWHAELFPSGDAAHLRFTAAWSPDVAELPTVRQEEEPLEAGFFGGGYTEEYDASDTKKVKAYQVMIQRETITISIHAGNAELLRCLHVIIRGLVLSSLQWLIGLGYDSLEYLGGGDIVPATDMMPEAQGVFMREQRWAAISQTQVALVDPTNKPAFVYIKDVDVTIGDTGQTGGVEPYSPTE